MCNPLFASEKVLNWIKVWENRLPRPLEKSDSVYNWWPIENGQKCRYKVIESKWNKSLEGKEFILSIQKDREDSSKYNFEVEDFNEFPYSGIKIIENRVFLISQNTDRQIPFLVFPLFEYTLYYDIEYEYEMLRKCICLTSDEGFFAPARNSFISVTKVENNLFYLSYIDARAQELGIFEKGKGLAEWALSGSIKIKRIDNSSINLDVYSYLPENAHIGRIDPELRKSGSRTKILGTKDALVFSDLDNDGIDEVVVFYSVPDYDGNSTMVILKPKKGGYEKLIEHTRIDAGYINPLSGVWDINNDGKLEIVVVRWVGASFGGFLDIFQWDGSKFIELNGVWNEKDDIATIEFEDLDDDDVVEITIRHRFSYPDIYKWENEGYSLVKEGSPYPTYR